MQLEHLEKSQLLWESDHSFLFEYVSVDPTVSDWQAVSRQAGENEEFQLHQSNNDCRTAYLSLAST